MKNIDRGTICIVNLGRCRGSELSGTRPCLVIHNPTVSIYSEKSICLPISNRKKSLPTHVRLTESMFLKNNNSRELITGIILAEQIKAIDKSKIISNTEIKLTKEAINKVEKAIIIALEITA